MVLVSRVGTVIDGKYEVLKQIGKGGMSVVYLAMDKHLNKQWAIKEIRKTASGKNNEIMVNSLIAEAHLMKKLDHPALPRIVDLIDYGTTILVVMDYIEGESLDKILERHGPQPQDVVIEWAMQICDALNYLHSQNPPIIYRDMKPANVMLKPEGNLKVIDFGIAREYKEKNLSDTTNLGTRGYAPPEQHGSRQTDIRADIFALGMTMHHLLTGVDPRPDNYVYVPIRQWNPELSGGLERIIDKCTALDPDNRYSNCSELMYALEHYEEEEGAYKKKQKRKLGTFLITVTLSLIMLIGGFVFQFLKNYTNDQDYEQKVNISVSTPYETKVSTYLDAIDLYGTDTRAYIKLLEAFEDNALFGDTESNQFTAKYNLYKEKFDTTTIDFLNLNYQAGLTYFYLYSGGDNTFRSRVLKAYPYFQIIEESANEEYEYYDMAISYCIVGRFYSNYVVNATSVKEPNKVAYEDLLASLKVCIEKMGEYDYDDSAYIKLTMYREIMNLLTDHRKGLATTGVEQESVMNILNTIRDNAVALSVTQQTSTEIQDYILNTYTECVENIKRSYMNVEERK